MFRINNFESFNEGLIDKLRKIPAKIGDLFKSEEEPERTLLSTLNDHEIFAEMIDEFNYKFYYIPARPNGTRDMSKKRLIARIFKIKDKYDMPTMKLYCYIYEADRRNLRNRSMNVMDPDPQIVAELEKQSEQPYFKLGRTADNAEILVEQILDYWMYDTITGKKREKLLMQGIKPRTGPTPAESIVKGIKFQQPYSQSIEQKN